MFGGATTINPPRPKDLVVVVCVVVFANRVTSMTSVSDISSSGARQHNNQEDPV
jgi:hypothetical protein